MEIYFKNNKLQKVCNTEKDARKAFGNEMAEKLMQRMTELKVVENLSQISRLPPARCHELDKGIFSVDLKHPYRLLFEVEKTIPLKEDGGIDKEKIKEIMIVSIEDTHDSKNQRR